MSRKEARRGIRIKLLAIMKENPEELYSIPDVISLLKVEHKTGDNLLRNMRIDGLVHRHVDKDINGDFQYAMKIPPNKIEPYVVARQANPATKSAKPKKGKTLTTKEIKSMFAMNFNNMAKMEDAVMASLDRLDDLEKEMMRIRNALGK